MGFKVIGRMDERIKKALLMVPDLELGPVIKDMFEPGLVMVKNAAQALAPKDTSKLARSIRITKFKERFRKNNNIFHQSVRTGTRKELGLKESGKEQGYYPAAQEYGWQEAGDGHVYFDKKRGRFVRTPSFTVPHAQRPYLRPAFYNNISNIRKEAANVAVKKIPDLFKRACAQ